MTPPRVIEFFGIHNFRDYGGYSAHGGRLRNGVLFRSGQHGDATDADLARLDTLGIATVFDLRGNAERRRSPCRRSPGFAGTVRLFDGETASGAPPHEEAAANADAGEEGRRRMRHVYRSMPFRAGLNAVLRQYFADLASAGTPSLVHCFAGKDRTGFAVWLLHRLLGVHPDDAMADYLLTNTAGDSAARIAAGRAAIEAQGRTIDDATLRAVMGVEADYLAIAEQALRDRHGSIEAYAAAELGVDKDARERLRETLMA